MALTIPNKMPDKFVPKVKVAPIPEDSYPAVCCGVIDMGTRMESYKGSPPTAKRRIKLQFEIPEIRREDGKTAIIGKTIYNLSYNESANWRLMLDEWLGTGWETKYASNQLDFLIGIPALIKVAAKPDKADPTKIVNTVTTVGSLPSRWGKVTGERDSFYLDLDDKYLPETLSAWDADKIRESLEYQAGGFRDDAPHVGEHRGTTTPPAPALPTRTGAPVDANDPGDGCPF